MAVVAGDLARMRTALFIEPPLRSRSSTRFWALLALASVIATAGVVADSTATVIGAMIVAPLMTPILGTALSVVLADRVHLRRSLLLVVGGGLLVVAIAFWIGVAVHPLDAYEANTQVSARINPRLIDLVAALATGTVGAFALVRSDISDTLPGVAIAISLVPPLAVVGLLLEVGRFADAAGAALLFLTNFAAIVATGTLVFLIAKIRDAAAGAGEPVGELRGLTLATIAAGLLVVAVPLAAGSWSVIQDYQRQAEATAVAQAWADAASLRLTSVAVSGGEVVVTAVGTAPQSAAGLRAAMDSAGLADEDLSLRLVAGVTQDCPAHSGGCVQAQAAPVP